MNNSNAKVLIVDDDVEFTEFVETCLSKNGYSTIIADNGRNALEKACQHLPDLILLDIFLPEMDGFDVFEKLKERDETKYIPVIMMTAKTSTERLVESLQAGAVEFISKPFNVDEFNARIEVVIRTKTAQDELRSLNRMLGDKIKKQKIELQRHYLKTIKSLINTVEAKDYYTQKHSTDVARYSVAIAKELGLSEIEIRDLKEAAELHDIGKIAISDSILHKKNELSKEDWDVIKLHPVKSVQILEPLEYLGSVIEIIKQHHERIDGTGYPEKLKGDNIKLEAKILAIADAYDAMTSERPYRKALSKEHAIKELNSNVGRQFDPDVLKVFLKILEKETDSIL